ncbi:hypothetical protein [Streptomyces sp. NY05-11A]|uniref:hypothetical protein n=1 Tax=Streptomyces soliscabiei TaxID=588897 RepID=UPI003B9B353D
MAALAVVHLTEQRGLVAPRLRLRLRLRLRRRRVRRQERRPLAPVPASPYGSSETVPPWQRGQVPSIRSPGPPSAARRTKTPVTTPA